MSYCFRKEATGMLEVPHRAWEQRMDLGKFGHLTYSTLVHPGDTWAEMWDSLTTYLPQVKARVCPDAAFGVSLRISASSAETRRSSRFAGDGRIQVF